mmetsp:Transcript_33301/g.75201  ORF Transcript_33301/g.75201 Transcript_33301/m.75201 type:complete len:305 (-) Transcript_33301:962-1876(-)
MGWTVAHRAGGRPIARRERREGRRARRLVRAAGKFRGPLSGLLKEGSRRGSRRRRPVRSTKARRLTRVARRRDGSQRKQTPSSWCVSPASSALGHRKALGHHKVPVSAAAASSVGLEERAEGAERAPRLRPSLEIPLERRTAQPQPRRRRRRRRVGVSGCGRCARRRCGCRRPGRMIRRACLGSGSFLKRATGGSRPKIWPPLQLRLGSALAQRPPPPSPPSFRASGGRARGPRARRLQLGRSPRPPGTLSLREGRRKRPGCTRGPRGAATPRRPSTSPTCMRTAGELPRSPSSPRRTFPSRSR